MAKLIRYLTLPAPKRRRTNKDGRKSEEKAAARVVVADPAYYVDDLCWIGDHHLERTSMRMVLLAENEHRVMFDSCSVLPTSAGQPTVPGARKSPDGKYQFLRRERDTGELGQMLFGTMAAAGGTASVKMHTLGDNKMLISRVFTMPTASAMRNNDETDRSVTSSCDSEYNYPNTVHSLDGLSHYVKKAATSCIPPEKFTLTRHSRSRYCSLQTTTGMPMDDSDPSSSSTEWDDLRALSPPHRVFSRTRRDETLPKNSLQDDQNTLFGLRSRFSSMSAEESRTVGLGIILEAHERNFLLQHMPLIEGELRRLEGRIILACGETATFIHHVYQAWASFCSCLCTLHNSARLRDPVWIQLLRRPRDAAATSRFCSLLAETSAVCETKNTKFFLSNVITAILMHHMAWIASVAPPPVKREVEEKMGESASSSSLGFSSLHGVNPHLAQLLEISGCVGGASRSARTVVCGSDGALISKILHCLSYFLRCTSIAHREDISLEGAVDGIPLDEETPSSSSSSLYSPSHSHASHLSSPASHHHHGSHSSHQRTQSYGGQPATRPMRIGARKESGHSDGSGFGSGEGCHIEYPSTSSSPLFASHDHQSGLGESLLAGPSYSYSPHFVLSGLLRSSESKYNNYLVKISDEMASYADSSIASARQEMCPSSPPPEHVTIVADCTDWTVKIHTYRPSEHLDEEGKPPPKKKKRLLLGDMVTELHSPAESIVQMMETFTGLQREGVSPHVLTDIMEDSLSDLLSKSIALVEILQLEGTIGQFPHISSLTSERVASVVGCDQSDLRLLLNIAAVYCPTVLTALEDSDDERDSDM